MAAARKLILRTLGALGIGGAGLALSLEYSVQAAELIVHPPKFKWSHDKFYETFDHSAIRRGYEVYKSVCSTCHSLRYVAYRDLVNVCHTEEEAKAEAEAIKVTDGPNDEGEMFERPGRLSDRFPSPYPNDEAARYANNGALPPDLSYITQARHGGEDYIFALLTGYCDPPAGIVLREGLYYNPYFPGAAIGMAQALYNGTIDYEDGTPASASQLAKDVSVFLKWCAEPEHDDRKRMGIKVILVEVVLFGLCYYYYKHVWSTMKTRKMIFKPRH